MASSKHDIISSFIAAQVGSARKHIVNFEIDKDPEHLHQLRVTIKKIRAILTFLEFVFHKKIGSKSLDTLFQKAGAIRMYEIALSNPNLRSCASSELFNHLLHTKKQLEEKFIGSIPDYKTVIKSFQKNVHNDLVLPETTIIAAYFLSRKIQAIDKFQSFQRDDLHQFRKIIKDLKYVYELIPGAKHQKIYFNTSLIDKLQKDVGAWHDTYSSLQLLSQISFPGTKACMDVLGKNELAQWAALKSNYPELNL